MGRGAGGRGMQWGVRLERPAAETFSLRSVLADCHTPTPGLALFPVGRTGAGKREAWTSSVHKERADRKFTSVRSMVSARPRLQALVYGILPSTTAVFSYAIGPENCQLTKKKNVGAQTVVSLLQTTHMKQGVSFITANKAYTTTNKTTIV